MGARSRVSVGDRYRVKVSVGDRCRVLGLGLGLG